MMAIRPDCHRAGETHVMHRDADPDGRADHRIGGVADGTGDHLGANGIRADQPVRSMLFGRADGQNNSLRPGQVGFDFLPGLMLQQHGVRSPKRRVSAA
jgi:hypothetical protein